MAYIGKSPTGTGVRSRFYYTQTSGGGTSISGTDDNSKTLTFTDGEYIDVYLNGVLLVAGTDYNTNTANTISGLAALANGDVVEVVVYDIFTVADTVSASQGGTFNAGVTINRAGNGVAQTIQNSGTTVGAIGIANGDNLFISSDDTTDVGIKFNGDGNRITPCDVAGADRDNLIDLGEGSARYKDFYIGGNIYIGGTGSANAFSDYEEGTWTPEIRNADNDNTFTTESGRYIKIGAVVVAYFINDGGNTGGGGGLQVRGLPFNSTNTAHLFGARGTAAVNNSSSTVRRNLIVNFNSGNSNSALLYYGGDFLSDTLTYVSGFIVYQTDA